MDGRTLSQNQDSSGTAREQPSVYFNSFHISEHEGSPRQSNLSLTEHPVDFDLVSPSNIFPKSQADMIKVDEKQEQEAPSEQHGYLESLIAKSKAQAQ